MRKSRKKFFLRNVEIVQKLQDDVQEDVSTKLIQTFIYSLVNLKSLYVGLY